MQCGFNGSTTLLKAVDADPGGTAKLGTLVDLELDSQCNIKGGYKVKLNIEGKMQTVSMVCNPGNISFFAISFPKTAGGQPQITYASPSCPSGYTVSSNGMCIANPSCSSGGLFDGSIDKCYLSYNKTCPSNSTYYSALDMCKADPVCAKGVLDTSSDKCYLSYTPTCSYGNYDSNNGICYSSPVCDLGNYNSANKRCIATVAKNCGNYYTWDDSSKKCINTPVCPKDQGYSLNSTIGYSPLLKKCISDTQHDCAGNYTYSPLPVEKCEIVPVCENGVYSNTTNGCFSNEYKCPIDPSLPCVGVEPGNHWCSPWKCNQDNKCGYAYCPNNNPGQDGNWEPRWNFYNFKYISDGQCIDAKCDLALNKDISYCSKSACPKGFGVYEKDGHCYKKACPENTYEYNGHCYKK